MKFNIQILLSIFWFIIVFCIILGITFLIVANISPKGICQSLCDYHNGTFWMTTDCDGDTMACAGFCEYDNKTIPCNKLLDDINSSI